MANRHEPPMCKRGFNDMPLSLQRTDIIGALCNFLFWDFVPASIVFGQSDQMRCQIVRN